MDHFDCGLALNRNFRVEKDWKQLILYFHIPKLLIKINYTILQIHKLPLYLLHPCISQFHH